MRKKLLRIFQPLKPPSDMNALVVMRGVTAPNGALVITAKSWGSTEPHGHCHLGASYRSTSLLVGYSGIGRVFAECCSQRVQMVGFIAKDFT